MTITVGITVASTDVTFGEGVLRFEDSTVALRWFQDWKQAYWSMFCSNEVNGGFLTIDLEVHSWLQVNRPGMQKL
jgi:hypothetical protein